MRQFRTVTSFESNIGRISRWRVASILTVVIFADWPLFMIARKTGHAIHLMEQSYSGRSNGKPLIINRGSSVITKRIDSDALGLEKILGGRISHRRVPIRGSDWYYRLSAWPLSDFPYICHFRRLSFSGGLRPRRPEDNEKIASNALLLWRGLDERSS